MVKYKCCEYRTRKNKPRAITIEHIKAVKNTAPQIKD